MYVWRIYVNDASPTLFLYFTYVSWRVVHRAILAICMLAGQVGPEIRS